ncbi:hypothetical protein Tco_0354587, partial [Tanacetum coccineum]
VCWEVKEKTCSHARKAATRVPVQEGRNPFPENVTIKERVHGGQKRSLKVAKGDTESQDQKNQSQALKKTTYPNHGSAKKHIPSHLVSATLIS